MIISIRSRTFEKELFRQMINSFNVINNNDNKKNTSKY